MHGFYALVRNSVYAVAVALLSVVIIVYKQFLFPIEIYIEKLKRGVIPQYRTIVAGRMKMTGSG